MTARSTHSRVIAPMSTATRGSRPFAFIQTAPDRIFVGWGPFEQLPFRRPERPAFYVTDFFLDDVHPWRHPSRWEELSVQELVSRFESGDLCCGLRIDLLEQRARRSSVVEDPGDVGERDAELGEAGDADERREVFGRVVAVAVR